MSTFKQNTAVQAVAPGPEGPPWMNDAETYWASRLAVGEHFTVVQVSVICYFKFLSDTVATVRYLGNTPVLSASSGSLPFPTLPVGQARLQAAVLWDSF
jgi:hypothetical protein